MLDQNIVPLLQLFRILNHEQFSYIDGGVGYIFPLFFSATKQCHQVNIITVKSLIVLFQYHGCLHCLQFMQSICFSSTNMWSKLCLVSVLIPNKPRPRSSTIFPQIIFNPHLQFLCSLTLTLTSFQLHTIPLSSALSEENPCLLTQKYIFHGSLLFYKTILQNILHGQL